MPTISPKVTPYYGGGQVVNPANVIRVTSTPSTAAIQNALGTIAVQNSNGHAWILASLSGHSATWTPIGGGGLAVATLTGDTGTATPSAGNIKIAGTANQITTAASGATVTLTLPAAITAPGSLTATTSLAATTSVTAGTTITATLGNITATNGSFVASTAGTGIVFNPGATSGTTTATLNARVGQVTITTPSIAAGATAVMTISNTSITGSGTQVGYWLTGGTTGAALTIQSYANTANQSVVTIQNGTGATTNTASLVLNFVVLN